MTKICITFLQVTPDITSYHALSLLITTYHTLSPRLEVKSFSFGYFKISSLALNFSSHLIMPCDSLSHLITPYPLGWKQNYFHLATLKLVPRPPIFFIIFYYALSFLITPYHNLCPRLEKKPI